jgi:site-specific recombinase XerD
MNEYLGIEIFNKEIKNKFLEKYPVESKRFYNYVFKKTYETELQLNKDLYDFTNDQLTTCIKSFNNASIQSVYSVISILRQYIDFCIKQGIVTTNTNYLNGIGGYNDIKKYLDVHACQNKYIDINTLRNITDLCLNSQDAVIFALLFEGVKGVRCEELVNLKKSDCNYQTNTLTLTQNNGDQRTLQVSDFTMQFIEDASNATKYIKNNGELDFSFVNAPAYTIQQNEYVLRISSREAQGAINPCNIIGRVNRIKTFYGNQYLTVTNIWISGMIHQAMQILINKYQLNDINLDTITSLSKNDYLLINKKFGFADIYWYKIKEKVETYINMQNLL